MKLNRKWLNEEFVDLSNVSDKEFVETLTVFGQKVETWERLDAEIKNVVVGKVLSMVRHPNSDHMWICQVDVGGDAPVQIVTGAQNVHEGDLVPAALHNSWLPGGVHITKGKLRGEPSNGMLCSFSELGLTQNDLPGVFADGIWILNDEDCTIGEDINLVIGNDDTVVDFEITNNRPDCYSIIGLAREAAAAFGKPMRHHEPVVHGSDAGDIYDHLDVDVPATKLCNRYTSRMVANVKIAPSPKWLRRRLRANGVRPINNIVDITNYVMLEYGQPMHAFDYRYVSSGKIVVREAEDGETLTTLDGSVRNLKAGMLVIADENKPIGLAGIMGGENSEIKDDTAMVVFESANFDGTSIRQTALALGMRTEASGKFEKRLDPMMTVPAVQRACELVEMLGCGDVLNGTIDVINYVPEEKTLPLEPEKINRLLGTNISKEDMVKYLNRLEIPVEGDTILVPDPCYPVFEAGAKIADAKLEYYPLVAGHNYLPYVAGIDPEVADRAKYMIVSLPAKPVGSVGTPEVYEEIIAFAREHDLLIVHDNAYSDIVYDGEPGGSFLQYPGALEVGVEFFSLSKSFNVTGARIGFLVGREDVVSAFAKLRGQIDFGMFFPIQKAAIACLNGPRDEVEAQRLKYQERRDALCDGLEGLGWERPNAHGSMFVWAKLPGGRTDSMAFCEELMEKAGVVVTPGASFGPSGEGHVRMALVLPPDQIALAVEAIREAGLY